MRVRQVWRASALAASVAVVISLAPTVQAAPTVGAAQVTNTGLPASPFDRPDVFCTKSPAPPAGARNSASPGISPTSITISDISLDTDALRRVGSDQANFHQFFAAFWDEVNRCGGINGRK